MLPENLLIGDLVAVSSEGNVTELLQAAGAGDAGAADRLLPLVYDQLRQLAHDCMVGEPPGQTLQPTALVHEAYLRLVGGAVLRWESQAHFFAAAARAMRRILVDRARRHGAPKHGGDRARISLEQIQVAADGSPPEHLVALDEALDQLERVDQRKAQIVMLRYFTGLTVAETAKALGLSPRTVKREWQFARVWLYGEMTRHDRAQR